MLGLRTLVPLLATAIMLVAPAEATTTYYQGASSEASFNTAVGGMTLLDPALTFASGDLGTDGLFNASGTGINFLGIDGYPQTDPLNLTVNSGALTATAGSEQVEITFPAAGVYAFGFHITLTTGAGSWFIGLTPGGTDYTVTNTSTSNVQFFGIVSTTPITGPLYIRNLGGNPVMVLPNFEAYGTAVPEPRTMLLVGLGLVILPLIRRNQKAG